MLQAGQRTLQKGLAGMKARAANHDLSKQWHAAASTPTMSHNEALRQAGQRLIKQGTAPTDLPPSIQAAYMQAQKQQSEPRFRRTVSSHKNDSQVQGQTPKLQVGKTALHGLSQAAQATVDAKDRLTGQYDVKQAQRPSATSRRAATTSVCVPWEKPATPGTKRIRRRPRRASGRTQIPRRGAATR